MPILANSSGSDCRSRASESIFRSLIACVERLSSEIVEVPLDDSGENAIRLRVMTGE